MTEEEKSILMLIRENLDKLENSEVWYKYTENRFFSKMEDTYYFVIKRGQLFYNELYKECNIRRMEVFKVIYDMINQNEKLKDFLIDVLDRYKDIVNLVIESGVDMDPLIINMFNLVDVLESGTIKIYLYGDKIIEEEYTSIENLEDLLEDIIDDVGKIEINNKVIYRHQLLTSEYNDIENKILLQGENYELLGWFQKIAKDCEMNK